MSREQVTPRVADRGDVQEYLSGAKVAWVQCRTKGHNMADHDVKENMEDNAFVVIYRCTRCYTKRDEVVHSVTGEVLSSKYYNHPDGYLLPKGTGRLDAEGRGLIRVTHLRNTLTRKRDLTEIASRRRKAS